MPEQVYDRGFKGEFLKTKYFLHFLRKYVKLPLADFLKESDLIAANGEHQGRDFLDRRSDVVFRVQNGEREIYFFVALELQAKMDFSMPMRMFFYLSDIIRESFTNADKQQRERKDYQPPAVVPIVFYSGRREWTAKKSFRKYTYQGDVFGDRVIDFSYELVSLRDLPEDIFQNVENGFDLIMTFTRMWLDGQYLDAVSELKEDIRMIPSSDFLDVADFVIDLYGDSMNNSLKTEMIDAFEKGDLEKMDAVFGDLYHWADDLREDGKKEGFKVGKHEGIIETAQKMLREKMDISLIAKCTGLSENEIEELQNK